MNIGKVRLTVLLSITALVAISGIVAVKLLDREHAVAAEPAGSTPGQTVEWGDIDCSQEITLRDYVSIARHLIRAQDLSQTEPCPGVGSDQHMVSPYDRSIVWGDVDCSGTLDAVDALLLEETFLGLASVPATEPCPGVSSSVQLAADQSTPNATPTPAPSQTIPASAEYFHVTVSLENSGVGALTVLIDYDPSTAFVVNCSPGNGLFCNAAYGAGKIGVDGVDAAGFATGSQIAYIDFFALSGTILTYSTITATDSNGQAVGLQLNIQPSELSPTPQVTASPSPTPTPSPIPSPTPPHLIRQRGDLNCDGAISIRDILPVLRATAGLSALNYCTMNAGDTAFDLNCDGAVNGQDALDLARFVIHLPVSLPSSCPSLDEFVIAY